MPDDANDDLLRSLFASVNQAAPGNDMVKRCLQAVRSHLGMDVAYVSEFVGNNAIFREVDAPGRESLIKVGDSHSLDDIYCRHILEGRLPQLIPDTSVEPVAAALPITQTLPVGKHVSVPIKMADGSVYGMFCCLGFKADPSLRERDLQMLKVFADLTAFEICRDAEALKTVKEKETRVRTALDHNEIAVVYQPIWAGEQPRPIGFECLARFSAQPYRSPDKWFTDAAETGLGTVLELAAIQLALVAFSCLPDDLYLTLNASPRTILSGQLPAMLEAMPAARIVLEVTEHAHVENYTELLDALQPLRRRGVRLAVDDAGAGFASLQHILQLQPNLIKLDISLTRNIDLDPARRALATALIAFAHETGSEIIAEGVETASELKALRAIGIDKAQGFFLGRPMSLAAAAKLCALPTQTAHRVA